MCAHVFFKRAAGRGCPPALLPVPFPSLVRSTTPYRTGGDGVSAKMRRAKSSHKKLEADCAVGKIKIRAGGETPKKSPRPGEGRRVESGRRVEW